MDRSHILRGVRTLSTSRPLADLRRQLAGVWGPPRTEAAALTCLFTNLLVLPGLGSLMGGRRREGWPQLALSLVGAGLALGFLVEFVGRWVRSGRYPLDLGPWLWWAVLGVALFGVAWLWSLATGRSLLAEVEGSRPRGGGDAGAAGESGLAGPRGCRGDGPGRLAGLAGRGGP